MTTGLSIERSYVSFFPHPHTSCLLFPSSLGSKGNGNESEEEEDDQTLLKTLETRLLNHDPTFSLTQTFLARSQQQNSLLTAFLRGDDGSASEPRFDPESLQQSYQLHLNVERSRVPEVWFQPSIAGLDSAGVGEIVEHVLRERSREEMRRMQEVSRVAISSLFRFSSFLLLLLVRLTQS